MHITEFKTKKFLNKLLSIEQKAYLDSPACDTVYEKGFTINGKAFNYLNSKSSNFSNKVFKPLITSVFDKLEAIYPTTGDVFLNFVMGNITKLNSLENLKAIEIECNEAINVIKQNSKNVHKNDFDHFLKSEISKENISIIKTITDNITINTKLYIDAGLIKKTVLKKTNEFTFNLTFDKDFLLNKTTWSAEDYNFVIIDGYIDSIGEIYHLLTKASENLEPYVIFCKGMNEEVKNVILQNLLRGTINLFPVSLEINELNLNILADIAMCHSSDVVSSLQGETISMVTKRTLSKGKKITIGKDYFNLEPLVDNSVIERHKRYLQKRIDESTVNANTELIEMRLKMINADKLLVKLGLVHLEDKRFLSDFKKINYFLKYGSSGIVNVSELSIFNDFCKHIPTTAALNLLNSIKSFCKTIYNVDGAVIIK